MEAKCDKTTHGLSVTDRHTDRHTQGLLYIDMFWGFGVKGSFDRIGPLAAPWEEML